MDVQARVEAVVVLHIEHYYQDLLLNFSAIQDLNDAARIINGFLLCDDKFGVNTGCSAVVTLKVSHAHFPRVENWVVSYRKEKWKTRVYRFVFLKGINLFGNIWFWLYLVLPLAVQVRRTLFINPPAWGHGRIRSTSLFAQPFHLKDFLG
ncbi:uncharacterized protein PHALS_10469 [Plasmopara halstedii]|uniref:Uncharacterized protein n=1 Tax=Plasmopara halstedii TaxID=4781 RepID=A0A0P1AHH0_PLAHL|nr:uncharacterized protein PHALS_10469 [Plasmopara halstedii]CEG40257.1 hypothetical protein PHALS_10469 [Plasmopara halstedii]|eukprot:XP_024576626.1 hypothetical protein PHALS_10469 [Plasmopara halstedii]